MALDKSAFVLIFGIIFTKHNTMKAKIFTLIFFFSFFLAGAQITITQNDLPFIGTLAGLVKDTAPVSVTPGGAGPNQVWDLSILVAEDTNGANFINPTGAPGGSNFPNANLAIPDSANNGASFFSKSPSGFDLVGVYTNFGFGPTAIIYNPVETWLSLPSTYQTSFNGTAKYQFTIPYSSPPIDSVRIKTTINYSSIVDGWGTITTPDFISINCLRQKLTEISTDSTFVHYYTTWAAAGSPTTDTTITYRWWSNEAKLFIAEVVTNSAGTVSGASYLINTKPFCTLTSTASSTNESGFNFNDGTATLSPSAGITPYVYFWSNGANTASVNGLSPGTYYVTVSDAINCSVMDTIVVEPYVCSFLVSASSSDETTFNGNNGSATAGTVGGNSPFTYSWSNGGNSATLTGLAPGNYSVTVTDNNGCTAMDSAIVDPYVCSFSVSASATGESSVNGNNGSASVVTNGGNFPFSYFWSNGGNTATVSGLAPGTYSVSVTDNNGCTAAGTTTVYAYVCSLGLSVSSTNETVSGASNGTVTATPSGGSTPYSFYWSNGGSTSAISALPPGQYSVTVTDMANCSITGSAIVNGGGCTLVIDSVISINNSCYGDSSGSVSVYVSGGTSPYLYNWNNGGNSFQISNLSASGGQIYSVTVSDAGNCFVSSSANITSPGLLSVNISESNASCNGTCDGAASVAVSGGTSPYTYLWSNGQMPYTLTGLCAGIYTVTIVDANGCTEVDSAIISEPDSISLTTGSTSASCGINNGTATATADSGSTPYSYLWDANAFNQTTSTATGLGAGSYSVTASDANGCSATGLAMVSNITGLMLSFTSNPVSCNGESDGIATATPAGGVPPYFISWGTNPVQNTYSATGLAAGIYFVTVTDSTGCTAFGSASISEPVAISISFTSNNVSCNGSCNGDVVVNAGGGVSPYTFIWGSPADPPIPGTWCAGIYYLTITDGTGCSKNDSVTVSEPFPISLIELDTTTMPLCFGGITSSTIYASGGNPPFSFLWSNGQTQSTATGLIAGNYSLTVTDSAGCSDSTTIFISQPAEITLILSSTSDSGNADGTASAAASGGTPPFSFAWSTSPVQTGSTATGLAYGSYSVLVTDANSCSDSGTVIVDLYVGINSFSSGPGAQISLFPNPVKDELTIQLNLSASGKTKIILINSLGQETLLFDQEEKGVRILKFDLSEYPGGVYYIKNIVDNSVPEYAPFVKM